MWLNAVENRGSGETLSEALTAEDAVTEFLLMGMRLTEGVDISRLHALGGDRFSNNIIRMTEMGFVETKAGRLCVSATGRPVLNGVLRELLAD